MKWIIFIAFFLVSFVGCSGNQRKFSSSDQSLLWIGDSQTAGSLGKLFYDHYIESKDYNQVHVYGVPSSSPRHWSSVSWKKSGSWLCNMKGRHNNKHWIPLKKEICPSDPDQSIYAHLIEKHRPSHVVFQFLGNSMGRSKTFITEKVGALLSSLSEDQHCTFITSPPYYKTLVERNELRAKTQEYFLDAIKERCDLVVGVTDETMKSFATQRSYFAKDKIHLSKEGAKVFYNYIIAQLSAE
jgi:hypothetical protein